MYIERHRESKREMPTEGRFGTDYRIRNLKKNGRWKYKRGTRETDRERKREHRKILGMNILSGYMTVED